MPGENNDDYGINQESKEESELEQRKENSAPLMLRPARLGWMKQVYRSEQAQELGTFTINNEKELADQEKNINKNMTNKKQDDFNQYRVDSNREKENKEREDGTE